MHLITLAENFKFNLKDIQECIGYADVQTTANIYGILTTKEKNIASPMSNLFTFESLENKIKEKNEKTLQTAQNTISQGFTVVGVTGLEPMASWSRTKRDTKLRHTPISLSIILVLWGNVKWENGKK